MTIIEFLSARIAEDEAAADNDRARAEATAKRLIIERHAKDFDPDPAVQNTYVPARGPQPPQIVTLALASVYAGHPDYDPNWAHFLRSATRQKQ